jgi:hypothetical protein
MLSRPFFAILLHLTFVIPSLCYNPKSAVLCNFAASCVFYIPSLCNNLKSAVFVQFSASCVFYIPRVCNNQTSDVFVQLFCILCSLYHFFYETIQNQPFVFAILLHLTCFISLLYPTI